MVNLYLSIPAHGMAIFSPVLQEGIKIQANMGCSVKQFLSTTFHISPEYIEAHLPTIMLNGKAVDDLDIATLEENAILALSSAMPGLAGASLRRQGYLSSMRSGITYRGKKKSEKLHRGTIVIKFFNAVIRELGLKLLYQGITMRAIDFSFLLQRLSIPLKNNCTNVMIEDQEITITELLRMKILAGNSDNEIFLKIKPDMTT